MIITKNKKRAILFFLYIYAILAAIIVWLTFFSTGLEIVEKISFEEGKQFFFKNTSSRLIKNIDISVLEVSGRTFPLMQIPVALPGEEIEIDVTPLQDYQEVYLLAEAPFHAGFKKLFRAPFSRQFILTGGKRGLNYKVKFPSIIFLEKPFILELEACNELDVVRKVDLSTVFEQEYFEEVQEPKKLTVPPNGCESIEYLLTPKEIGQTTVFFNIEVENVKEQLPKTIEIVR